MPNKTIDFYVVNEIDKTKHVEKVEQFYRRSIQPNLANEVFPDQLRILAILKCKGQSPNSRTYHSVEYTFARDVFLFNKAGDYINLFIESDTVHTGSLEEGISSFIGESTKAPSYKTILKTIKEYIEDVGHPVIMVYNQLLNKTKKAANKLGFEPQIRNKFRIDQTFT